MEIMKKIFQMIHTFSYIMTGTSICTASFITLFYPDLKITVILLWQMLAISAICAMGNVFYYHKDTLSKKQMVYRIVGHYIYINFIVIGGGLVLGWIDLSLIQELLYMIVLVAIVYTVIMMVNFRQEYKMAEAINRELRRRYPTEDD